MHLSTFRGFAASVASLSYVFTMLAWIITLRVLHYVSMCKW